MENAQRQAEKLSQSLDVAELRNTTELYALHVWLSARATDGDGLLRIALGEIQLAFGKSEPTVRRWLKKLMEKGYLERCEIVRAQSGSIRVIKLAKSSETSVATAFVTSPMTPLTPADPDVAGLEKILGDARASQNLKLRAFSPMAIGAALPTMARGSLERSRSNVPGLERSKEVPTVPERRIVDLRAEVGTFERPQAVQPADAIRRFHKRIMGVCGEPAAGYGHTAWSLAIAGSEFLSECAYEAILEAARRAPNSRLRWPWAYKAFVEQVNFRGKQAAAAAGLWNSKAGKPAYHLNTYLQRRLAAIGVTWDPSWGSAARARPPPAN